MSDIVNEPETSAAPSFAEQASEPQPSIVREFWDFLAENKKWWLTPIILVLLLMGVFIFIALSSPAAPFIYTLF
jgi:hypothetical protein